MTNAATPSRPTNLQKLTDTTEMAQSACNKVKCAGKNRIDINNTLQFTIDQSEL
jgi:hypothetical protein